MCAGMLMCGVGQGKGRRGGAVWVRACAGGVCACRSAHACAHGRVYARAWRYGKLTWRWGSGRKTQSRERQEPPLPPPRSRPPHHPRTRSLAAPHSHTSAATRHAHRHHRPLPRNPHHHSRRSDRITPRHISAANRSNNTADAQPKVQINSPPLWHPCGSLKVSPTWERQGQAHRLRAAGAQPRAGRVSLLSPGASGTASQPMRWPRSSVRGPQGE